MKGADRPHPPHGLSTTSATVLFASITMQSTAAHFIAPRSCNDTASACCTPHAQCDMVCDGSMSFAEEKDHKADERVAAAEARARQAEEQLMSIAATLR